MLTKYLWHHYYRLIWSKNLTFSTPTSFSLESQSFFSDKVNQNTPFNLNLLYFLTFAHISMCVISFYKSSFSFYKLFLKLYKSIFGTNKARPSKLYCVSLQYLELDYSFWHFQCGQLSLSFLGYICTHLVLLFS